jgi:hypothetical protein
MSTVVRKQVVKCASKWTRIAEVDVGAHGVRAAAAASDVVRRADGEDRRCGARERRSLSMIVAANVQGRTPPAPITPRKE